MAVTKSVISDTRRMLFVTPCRIVGTDFALMHTLMPWRTRTELKNKFKREEKYNLAKVSDCLVSDELCSNAEGMVGFCRSCLCEEKWFLTYFDDCVTLCIPVLLRIHVVLRIPVVLRTPVVLCIPAG